MPITASGGPSAPTRRRAASTTSVARAEMAATVTSSGSRPRRSRAAIRSSSRFFQRTSSSTVAPVTGGPRSSAASTRHRVGVRLHDTGQLSTGAGDGDGRGGGIGVVGEELGRVRLGDDEPLEGESARRRCRRPLDGLLQSVHEQSVACAGPAQLRPDFSTLHVSGQEVTAYVKSSGFRPSRLAPVRRPGRGGGSCHRRRRVGGAGGRV